MKILIHFAFFLYSQSLFAGKAAVIVLEAPIFKERSTDSKIEDYVRKGKILYIHDKDLSESPNEIDYDIIEYKDNYFPTDILEPESGFYQLVDKRGMEGYILAKHVKVIYADERENLSEINPFEHDPMDYRLEEPLPEGYPINSGKRYRSLISYGFGPMTKLNYPYPANITGEEFATRKGVNFQYLKKVDFDPYDRFYFGAGVIFYSGKSTFQLDNSSNAAEDHYQFSVGPYFSYDAFRVNRVILSFIGGLTFNYNKMDLEIKGKTASENRSFSAFTVTPRLGSLVSIKTGFPKAEVFFGAELQGIHPYSLTSSSRPENPELWNLTNDSYSHDISAQFSFFIGFKSRY